MVMLFVDSKINHLQEVTGERVSLDFDSMTGELYINALQTGKYIKLSSNININNEGRYVIISDNDNNSLFIMKDLNEEEL
nr:MAG TPA: hypothetical protein [Caudoviricetes sp.]